jgi:hypothetical protein
MIRWNPSIIIASGLFAIEVLFGFGILGGSGFLVALICIVLYVVDKNSWRGLLRVALVFAVLGLATFFWINFNWRVAERRARPIAEACESFHHQNGRYPASLNDLVPQYLVSIPPAKYTVFGNRFGYSDTPPTLFFAVMFSGAARYDLESRKWLTND